MSLSMSIKYIGLQSTPYPSLWLKVTVKFSAQCNCQGRAPSEAPHATPARARFALLLSFLPLLFSSRSLHPHCLPSSHKPEQTALWAATSATRHLGFVKSFADELKLIFHLSFEVIRFKLVTFSGHKTPGMFYSLSVFISETNTCNPFQGRETSMKCHPTQPRFLYLSLDRGSQLQHGHCSSLVAHLSSRVSCPQKCSRCWHLRTRWN